MYSVDGHVHGENHCFQTDATAFARDTLCLAGASRRRWSFNMSCCREMSWSWLPIYIKFYQSSHHLIWHTITSFLMFGIMGIPMVSFNGWPCPSSCQNVTMAVMCSIKIPSALLILPKPQLIFIGATWSMYFLGDFFCQLEVLRTISMKIKYEIVLEITGSIYF